MSQDPLEQPDIFDRLSRVSFQIMKYGLIVETALVAIAAMVLVLV